MLICANIKASSCKIINILQRFEFYFEKKSCKNKIPIFYLIFYLYFSKNNVTFDIFMCKHYSVNQYLPTSHILTSYNSHMGNATTDNVNMSDVGVIMAAIINMAIMACLRKRFINPADNISSFANSQQSTGSSNRIPIHAHISSKVSIQDWSVIILTTSPLT